MKVFVCSLVLAVAAMTGASRSVSAQSVDPTLQKAMDARRAARPAKDLDTWARLTADDAMEIHSDGRVHTKTEEIAEIKAGTPPARPDGRDTDIKVRMYGSTAVYTAQRNPSDGPRRLAVVWVKGTAEQWRVVLTQQSPLSKP